MSTHEYYMERALELAKKGWGRTNPNPLVGAVIVKNGEIIAEGYHKALGSAHAEVEAINNARQDVRGGILYVNLEPCSHYGRTPPCAKTVIEAGISEVVVAMVDPNPKVSGRGVQMMSEAGIKVTAGVLEDEAKKLNEIFIKYITQKKPFVILKTAMTLDGKIASVTGDSKWISSELSRQYAHALRDRVSAVMVGLNTVLIDDPHLTTRLESGEGKDPVRIVVDSKGEIPLDSNVVAAKSNAGVILATTARIDSGKEELLLKKGVHIIKKDRNVKTDDKDDKVDLQKLMDELYKMEIDSVLLEGGGNLNAAALKMGIVDKVVFFIAPKIIGGKKAITPVEGDGIELVKDAIGLQDINVKTIGEDIVVEGYIKG